jgi:gliding motility-associated-like protein
VSAIPSTGGAFNAANGTFAMAGQLPGTYSFDYTLAASGACPGKSSTVDIVIEPLPIAVIAPPDVLDCANPMLRLDATGSSFGPDFDIAWSGPGIVADGNEATLRPTVDQAGDYQLTVTHRQTGCLATASVTVTAMTDPPTSALIEQQDPSCFGIVDGQLSVLAVDGGMPPYQYSLDGGPWSSSGTFAALPAGDHSLLLEDVNGCRWDTVITLVEPGAISIDLGPDLEIGLGDSASVQATVILSASPMDTVLWSPANNVYCQDASCLQVGILAANTGPLQATLIDENGCTATDQILITLNKDRRIYIPNIFSPNGDGINDRFSIGGDPGQVIRVKSLRIFDRWGSEVYAAVDFGLGDPDTYWDGRFRQDLLNPGVFTYYAEVEFIDGIVVPYRGDVTVLR